MAALENANQATDTALLVSLPDIGKRQTAGSRTIATSAPKEKASFLEIVESSARRVQRLNPLDTLRKIAVHNMETALADYKRTKEEETGKVCLYIILTCLGIFLLSMLIGILAEGLFDEGGLQMILFLLLILGAVVLGVRTKKRLEQPDPEAVPETPQDPSGPPPGRSTRPEYPNPDKNPANILLLLGTAIVALFVIMLVLFIDIIEDSAGILLTLLFIAGLIMILAGLAMLEGQKRF